MIEVKGKYCKDAKIFNDTVESEALSTVYGLCESPAFKDAHIRCMPDCHSGKGVVVGFTCPVGDFVDPNHIGVDIGCEVTSIELSKTLDPGDYENFNHKVLEAIPTGFNLHKTQIYDEKELYKFLTKEYNKARSTWPEMIEDIGRVDEKYITGLCKRIGMDLGVFYKSLGTLGGGENDCLQNS